MVLQREMLIYFSEWIAIVHKDMLMFNVFKFTSIFRLATQVFFICQTKHILAQLWWEYLDNAYCFQSSKQPRHNFMVQEIFLYEGHRIKRLPVCTIAHSKVARWQPRHLQEKAPSSWHQWWTAWQWQCSTLHLPAAPRILLRLSCMCKCWVFCQQFRGDIIHQVIIHPPKGEKQEASVNYCMLLHWGDGLWNAEVTMTFFFLI